jgi:hypothetical protein
MARVRDPVAGDPRSARARAPPAPASWWTVSPDVWRAVAVAQLHPGGRLRCPGARQPHPSAALLAAAAIPAHHRPDAGGRAGPRRGMRIEQDHRRPAARKRGARCAPEQASLRPSVSQAARARFRVRAAVRGRFISMRRLLSSDRARPDGIADRARVVPCPGAWRAARARDPRLRSVGVDLHGKGVWVFQARWLRRRAHRALHTGGAGSLFRPARLPARRDAIHPPRGADSRFS